MITRIVNLPNKLDFFLFGPRSTGKTTLLRTLFSDPEVLWIDLLDRELFERLIDEPQAFGRLLETEVGKKKTIVIDEIQKAPQLLDDVQNHLQKKNFRFILTGSSARKLKRGQANLLGGRTVVRNLWSLTHQEIPKPDFSISDVLRWGTLPKVFSTSSIEEKKDLLRAYVQTYLAEEVVAEQLVRNLTPFRKFLAVAGQMNGKIINASKIGRDVGADHNTVNSYFEILEDTLIGFHLPAYATSLRASVRKKPKFYIFDVGVARAMTRTLDVRLVERTAHYGTVFEQYMVTEIFRLTNYLHPDWSLFYLSTKDDAEIDLVIERPGLKPALIELKSSARLDTVELDSTLALMRDFGKADCYVLSRDPVKQKIGPATALPWEMGIREVLGSGLEP